MVCKEMRDQCIVERVYLEQKEKDKLNYTQRKAIQSGKGEMKMEIKEENEKRFARPSVKVLLNQALIC